VTNFTEEEIERYSRNILLSEIGVAGQRRLKACRAFVVGAGGIGSAAILYLAAAGVGRIGIADGDAVERSNLQRQILHRTDDVGRGKVASGADAVHRLNPNCEVAPFPYRLDAANIADSMAGYDVVLDGSDTFQTRFLVADCCWLNRLPLVSAAATGWVGQLLTVVPGELNPCYRCLMPEPPPAEAVPSCREAGVLGAVVGVMGCLQAVEAIKLIAGIGGSTATRLVSYDARQCRFVSMERRRNPRCPLCGDSPTITSLRHVGDGCRPLVTNGCTT
jgi:molybdopterin/thiamine biosynthesis adenylyltransferase